MTESPLDWADDTDADATAEDRKRQLKIVGGVAGVAVLAGAAFLLLHGGRSSSSTGDGGLVAGAHHRAPVASAPAAVPSAVPTAAVFHGSVGHDPFAVPAAITAALAAPVQVSKPATTPAAPAAGIGSVTIPAATHGSTPSQGSAQTPVQWIQLLASHAQQDGSYNVDVRTVKGTFKNIKPGTEKIGGTFFSYIGDDSSQGPHVYEFFAGESGGSLVPNAKVTKYTAGSLNNQKVALSTLVYSNHQVDGGVQFG